jgi:Zn-finger nucleic acid-binding protein
LQSVALGGVRLEECGRCGGLWVGNDVFQQICASTQAQDLAVKISQPTPTLQEFGREYLKCPQCTQLMNRYNFASRSGVVIDKCSKHGTWFDRDELRRIIDFIRAGGWAIAREDQAEAANRERAARDAKLYSPPPTGFASFTSTSGGGDGSAGEIVGAIAGVLLSIFG